MIARFFSASCATCYMDRQRRRLWQSWEDYMRDWCKRRDFCEALPELLEGEDVDFARHIFQLAGLEEREAHA